MTVTSQLPPVTNRIVEWSLKVAAASLVLMTLITGWQVFARYILNNSPTWSEALALLLMLYYIQLAAAAGVAQGFHIGMTLLLDSAPEPLRRFLLLFGQSMIFGVGITMAVNGVFLANFTAEHVIPSLGVSRAFAYWPFVGAGVLMALFALERIYLILRKGGN